MDRTTRKRRRADGDCINDDFIQLDSSDSEDDVICSQFHQDHTNANKSSSDDDIASGDSSSDSSARRNFNKQLYEKLLKDYKKIKAMKNRMYMALHGQQVPHSNRVPAQRSSSGFTRQSISKFAGVIGSLTEDRKNVIRRYGFGSLLLFDKCFVPKSFSKWLASLVEFRSGDIIIHGRVISLTAQSVHHVLGIPVGGSSFPSNYSVGKSVVLSKINKPSLPQVTFFCKKLSDPNLSDQEIVMYFLIVALHCFLCPNSNLVPSPRYLGVFEDLENIASYDWCGFVLRWLLDGVKSFIHGKKDAQQSSSTLSGCLYYLAVVYLDHVDFSHRQLADSIPRIEVWKQNLITEFSELDRKSISVYGLRPLLDSDKTCYHKVSLVHPMSDVLDSDELEFLSKLDKACGCVVPEVLKASVLSVIEDHCNSSLAPIPVDVVSLADLPDDMKKLFSKLMNHVYTLKSKSRKLVLNVLKLFAEYDSSKDADQYSQLSPSAHHNSIPSPIVPEGCDGDVLMHSSSDNVPTDPNGVSQVKSQSNGDMFAAGPSHKSHLNVGTQVKSQSKVDIFAAGPCHISDPNVGTQVKSQSKVDIFAAGPSHISDPNVGTQVKSHSKVDIFAAGSSLKCPSQPVLKGVRFSSQSALRLPSQSAGHGSHVPKCSKGIAPHDVVQVVDEESSDSDKEPLVSPNHYDGPALVMTSLPFTDPDSTRATRTLSQKKSSPEVVILGAKPGGNPLNDKIQLIGKALQDLYPSKMKASTSHGESSQRSLSKTLAHPYQTPSELVGTSSKSDFKLSVSSTGGKEPIHGPRRTVVPNSLLRNDFVLEGSSYKVSKALTLNYNCILRLAYSRFSREPAVLFGNVKCTFWGLGESMKPDGMVLNFAINAYCFYLSSVPNGHPDISKRHYLFSTIGENLLKDRSAANTEPFDKVFKMHSKTRPVYCADMLYLPCLHDGHWFVFVVDIKDRLWVFLDSFYGINDDYYNVIRGKLISNFQYWWKQYGLLDMGFHGYKLSYPHVPKQPDLNFVDSGIYVMMFLQRWKSPRTSLFSEFKQSDIANLRIMLCNDLLLADRNTGRKDLVEKYLHSDEI